MSNTIKGLKQAKLLTYDQAKEIEASLFALNRIGARLHETLAHADGRELLVYEAVGESAVVICVVVHDEVVDYEAYDDRAAFQRAYKLHLLPTYKHEGGYWVAHDEAGGVYFGLTLEEAEEKRDAGVVGYTPGDCHAAH